MTYKLFLTMFSIFICLLSFLILSRALLLNNYPDFKVNYYGATHLLSHKNPYLTDLRYFTPQVYPPVDMVFFIPLVVFPEAIAAKIWISLSIMCVISSVWLLTRVYSISFFSLPNMIFLTGVFLAFPFKFTLGMGQINAVLLWFVCLAFYFYKQKRNLLAGSLLAFPLLIKFFPLLLVPYFFYLRKWRVLLGVVCFSVYLILISLYFVPLDTQVYFVTKILPSLLMSWKGDYYNQALSGLVMRSVSDPVLRTTLKLGVSIILVLITAGIILLRKQTEKVQDLSIACIITLSILINNFSWQHHYLFLLLPFFIVYRHIRLLKYPTWHYGILFVAYLFIMYNIKSPASFPPLVLSHVFYGGLILWGQCLYLLWKEKHQTT